MENILVDVHYAAGTRPRFEVPRKEVEAYFSRFGVPLELRAGQDPLERPALEKSHLADIFGDVDQVPGSQAPWGSRQPGARVHLLVLAGFIAPTGSEPLGWMFHPRRAAAAVFVDGALKPKPGGGTWSEPERREILFRTCLHEIGHMFNLVHVSDPEPGVPPTGGTYSVTMQQHRLRAGEPADAWARSGLPNPVLPAFPFGSRSRAWLRNLEGAPADRDKLLPWGTAFRGSGTLDSAQRGPGTLTLRFEIPERGLQVGDCVELDFGVRNDGRRGRRVPADVTPEHGTVHLVVERPDGSSYEHRPRHAICSSDSVVLAPGRTQWSPYVLRDGPGGVVFPMPGTYRLEARMEGVGGDSIARRLRIASQPRFSELSASFLREVATEVSAAGQGFVRKANSIIKKRGRGGILPGVLALARAQAMQVRSRAEELLSIAWDREGARAVRAEAFVTWAVSCCRSDEEFRAFEQRALESIGSGAREEVIRRAISRVGRRAPWRDES